MLGLFELSVYTQYNDTGSRIHIADDTLTLKHLLAIRLSDVDILGCTQDLTPYIPMSGQLT